MLRVFIRAPLPPAPRRVVRSGADRCAGDAGTGCARHALDIKRHDGFQKQAKPSHFSVGSANVAE
eukprot:650430-Lingulodinium_polyedra.AAC.1